MSKSKNMELIETTINNGEPVRAKSAFPVEAVSFRVLAKGESSSRIAAYVDARDVMERLDDMFIGWGDSYTLVADHREEGLHQVTMKCVISLPGDAFQQVSDVGTMQITGSRLPDENIYKSAASDAFKRAAVHLGIGRELYDFKKVMGKDLYLSNGMLNGSFLSKGGQREARSQWTEYLAKLHAAQNEASPYENVTLEEMRALSIALGLDSTGKQNAHNLAVSGSSLDEI